VKLISHDENRFVLRLDKREHDALMAVLGLRAHLPRKNPSLMADTVVDAKLKEAESDLHTALEENRRDLSNALARLMEDPEKVSTQGRGKLLKMEASELDLILQGLNDARIAAWESLGSPDFDQGQRPEVTEDNFLGLWTIQATDLFQSFLLAVLRGDPENP